MISTLRTLAEDGNVFLDFSPAAPKIGSSAHFGASNAREFASWNPSSGSADSDILPDLDTLRARSRDLARNHGVAGSGIQTLVDNVIGTGLRLSSTADYKALGKDKKWQIEWGNKVESLFREWAETTECDAAGCLNFVGLTIQITRAGLINGEALALPLWLPRSRSKWKTRIQVVEADRLSNPNNQSDDERLRGGIEIDKYGRPLYFHIAKTHPGDMLPIRANLAMQWEKIPAETRWGRRRVIHVHDRERTGQSRGKPILSSVLAQFRMLDHYQRTELQAAVVNAMIAAFIETPMSPEAVAEMLGGGDIQNERFQNYLEMQREYTAPLKGAAIIPTTPGSKISPFLPSRPADAFAPFVEAVTRQIGVAYGLPYELLMKDFSKTNYSSARAALLEAWRFIRGRREWQATYWAQPVYELWLEEAVSAGLIDAPGFYDNKYAYCKAKWIGPGRGWIDPVKEAEAAVIRMQNNLSTLEMECSEQGEDWNEILEQRATEKELLKSLGLDEPIVPIKSSAENEQSERKEPSS